MVKFGFLDLNLWNCLDPEHNKEEKELFYFLTENEKNKEKDLFTKEFPLSITKLMQFSIDTKGNIPLISNPLFARSLTN